MIVLRPYHLVVALALSLAVLPAAAARAVETVEVQTVPPTAGMRLIVGGQEVVTDDAGRASATVSDTRGVEIRQPGRYAKVGPGVRAKIAGIHGGGASRIARLELHYAVEFAFTTVDGERVDNDTIELVELRSSTGKVMRFAPTRPVWLQGVRVAPLNGVPTPKDIWWNIDDARVRGTTVVNRSQQRFEPSKMPTGDRTVHVELLYFDASVQVRDAFLGSPVTGELIVEHPDGSVARHTLDADGVVHLGDVPRGQYQMAVAGRGLRIPRPITVTRDVNDELRFYSWLDVGLATTFIALFLVGLVAIGARRRTSRAAAPPESAADGSEE